MNEEDVKLLTQLYKEGVISKDTFERLKAARRTASTFKWSTVVIISCIVAIIALPIFAAITHATTSKFWEVFCLFWSLICFIWGIAGMVVAAD